MTHTINWNFRGGEPGEPNMEELEADWVARAIEEEGRELGGIEMRDEEQEDAWIFSTETEMIEP